MIGYIKGNIVRVGDKELVILTSGVGYRVLVSERILSVAKIGQEMELHTFLSVREDALDLFGFANTAELEVFELLRSVSGIGPRTALTIVAGTEPASLITAIALSDMDYLTKLSGIGRKSAEKIVLELREKLKDRATGESTYAGKAEREALEALESLGYSVRDIREIVRTISKEETEANAIVSKTLKSLGRPLTK